MYIPQSGKTPLHEVSCHGNNGQVAESLIKAGANVNAVDEVSHYHMP